MSEFRVRIWVNMMRTDFWRSSKVAVVGGGSWGTVLAQLASRNCREVRLWVRDENLARTINSTRVNKTYMPELYLNENIHAFSALDRVFQDNVNVIIWALPSGVTRSQARACAGFLRGDELILHATKGIEAGTMKRISEILVDELPARRVGMVSGPNLAHEIAKGQPAATTVASAFNEVCEVGQWLLTQENFRIYTANDIVGVEWAGALKNILAIASGALEGMSLGWNTRALFITRGLVEMVRFGNAMGAQESTFLTLAGIGDLLATCLSPLSRNYRVGFRIAGGEKLEKILEDLGSVAEGVPTTYSVCEYATLRGIPMPITESVYQLLRGEVTASEALKKLMTRPSVS